MAIEYSKTTKGKTFSSAYMEVKSIKIIPTPGGGGNVTATYNIYPSSTYKDEVLGSEVRHIGFASSFTKKTPVQYVEQTLLSDSEFLGGSVVA